MVIMRLEADNLCGFHSFDIDFSYPKKPVHSTIPDEHLSGFPNFRYKKVNILMGTNASGKTSIGRILMAVFNFVKNQDSSLLSSLVGRKSREATVYLDMVVNSPILHRIGMHLTPKENQTGNDDFVITVYHGMTPIHPRDNYETCKAALDQMQPVFSSDYSDELEGLEEFGWYFSYPGERSRRLLSSPNGNGRYIDVLKNVLSSLDCSITDVIPVDGAKNTYLIYSTNQDDAIVLKDGALIESDRSRLSSGTVHGIYIASMLTDIIEHRNGFYYCDEQFSYTASDIEKACLAVMTQKIEDNEQLIFTTHNSDVLDMGLPKHSFIFLRKSIGENGADVTAVDASYYLKKNTDSVKRAVENDLFSAAPDTSRIFSLEEI